MSRYWLNQFFIDTQKADGLAAFKVKPSACLQRYPLSPELREALVQLDVAALYRAGGNPYLLRFFCVNMGMAEADYLRALRSAKG